MKRKGDAIAITTLVIGIGGLIIAIFALPATIAQGQGTKAANWCSEQEYQNHKEWCDNYYKKHPKLENKDSTLNKE